MFLRRSLEKYPEVKSGWDIVGGRIDPGKTLMENLGREIKEEINLDLIGKPQLIAAQDIIPSSDRHIVRLTYVGEAEGEITLDEEENDMYKWHTLEELKAHDDLDMYFKKLLDNGVIQNQGL